MNPVVTLGGITIGLAALVRVAVDWWPGRKAFTGRKADYLSALLPLMPFFWGYCFGVLVPLTFGGFLLWAGWAGVTAMSWLGDVALWAGVGSDIGTEAQRAARVTLTAQANAMMFLALVVWVSVFARWRNSYLVYGTVCGLCLGLTSGVAGKTAVPLASALDRAAVLVYGVLT